MNTDRESLFNSYTELKKVLNQFDLTETDFQVPSIHQDLADAQEQVILTSLDQARAREENNLMSSDDKKSIMAKINKWKDSEAKEDDFVQNIEDLYSGRTQEKAVEEGEEVTPEPLTTETTSVQKQEDIDTLIDKARNGDQEAQNTLNEHGIPYHHGQVYRYVSKREIDALNRGERITTEKGMDWVDVTDNPQPSTGADAEYRIVFKSDVDFDKEGGRGKDTQLKNEDLGDGWLKGGYTKNDVLRIERRNEDGTYSQIKEQENEKVQERELHEAYDDFISSGEWKIS
mgnify:FL=1